MSKRVVFEQTDSNFCECAKPEIVDATIHEQYGGNIREVKLGTYCMKCKKDMAPKDLSIDET